MNGTRLSNPPPKPRNTAPPQDLHAKMKLSNNDLIAKLKIDQTQPIKPSFLQDEPDDPCFDIKNEDKNRNLNNNALQPIQAKPKRDELGMLTKQKKALGLKTMPI